MSDGKPREAPGDRLGDRCNSVTAEVPVAYRHGHRGAPVAATDVTLRARVSNDGRGNHGCRYMAILLALLVNKERRLSVRELTGSDKVATSNTLHRALRELHRMGVLEWFFTKHPHPATKRMYHRKVYFVDPAGLPAKVPRV